MTQSSQSVRSQAASQAARQPSARRRCFRLPPPGSTVAQQMLLFPCTTTMSRTVQYSTQFLPPHRPYHMCHHSSCHVSSLMSHHTLKTTSLQQCLSPPFSYSHPVYCTVLESLLPFDQPYCQLFLKRDPFYCIYLINYFHNAVHYIILHYSCTVLHCCIFWKPISQLSNV